MLLQIVLIIIVLSLVYTYLSQPNIKESYCILKENIKPGIIKINSPKEQNYFLLISQFPINSKRNFIPVSMTPKNFINQSTYTIQNYISMIKRGNIPVLLRITNPAFNLNILYDQMMYFYIIDGNGNIVEDKFTINNDGKRLIVNKLK